MCVEGEGERRSTYAKDIIKREGRQTTDSYSQAGTGHHRLVQPGSYNLQTTSADLFEEDVFGLVRSREENHKTVGATAP